MIVFTNHRGLKELIDKVLNPNEGRKQTSKKSNLCEHFTIMLLWLDNENNVIMICKNQCLILKYGCSNCMFHK